MDTNNVNHSMDSWFVSRVKFWWPVLIVFITASGWFFYIYNQLENKTNAQEQRIDTLEKATDEFLPQAQQSINNNAVLQATTIDKFETINKRLDSLESKLGQLTLNGNQNQDLLEQILKIITN